MTQDNKVLMYCTYSVMNILYFLGRIQFRFSSIPIKLTSLVGEHSLYIFLIFSLLYSGQFISISSIAMFSISYVVYNYCSEGLLVQNLHRLVLPNVVFLFVPDLIGQIMYHEIISSKCKIYSKVFNLSSIFPLIGTGFQISAAV